MGEGKTEAANQRIVAQCLESPEFCPDMVDGLHTRGNSFVKNDKAFLKMIGGKDLPDVKDIIPGHLSKKIDF